MKMKNLRTMACCLSLTLSVHAVSAQQNDTLLHELDLKKPALFKQAPERISVETFQLASLLVISVGEPVVLDLPSFRFEGTVISKVSKYSNTMQSVVIRSSNYPGATFSLTKVTDKSGNISYKGIILSMKHDDLYELKQTTDGMILVKNKFNNVINE